ncbi:alpha/beta hydrolase [Sphingomonas abietis]|uniref:Dienelactone hydrolase family protein n=1 Tax=Sphingomonas abietis TaxID=3012344 RepID=A0ABY7NMV7_9SPHN|nr:dienelactone hydrolase family protein [Sphingomonas abietis]WBO22849.1 dienelactone hydrolase family protein [Sphingomonas abietis]
MTGALVILLHGVGSRGADIAGLATHWQDRLPDTAFAAPDGPFAFDQAPSGRQWFSVRNVTDANRAERIVAAREAFDRVLARHVADHGFEDRLDRVTLVGFSQGSIMALDAAVSGRWPVKAVVAFSGRLASPLPFASPPATRFALIHGRNDPVIPVAESERAAVLLRDAGADVRLHICEGLGHAISPEAALIAEAFLTE